MSKTAIIILFGAILLGCTPDKAKKQPEKPNILIILADDAGYADFGFMGETDLKTPNIDLLAKNGMVFTDAHTSASVCSPSRAGLLTGRYQQRFGHENNSPPKGLGMDPSETTIADILKEQGYATAIFGKWHLGDTEAYHPNQRGFDEFYGFLGGHRPYFANQNADRPGRGTAMQFNGKYLNFEGYLTDVLGDKTIDFIEKNKENPWFAFLSYNAVHTPMQATDEDMAIFEGHHRQKLAAMTWAMDRSIGNVINKLKEEKLLDNTLVFFFSDNGGPTGSNQSSNLPLKSTKGYEFEGGHRIPMILYYEGHVKQGTLCHGLTSTLDVFPTILSALDIKDYHGKPLDGVDLLPYATGTKKGNPHKSLFWRIGPWTAARDGHYKIVTAKKVDTALYDLKADIGEKTNLMDHKTMLFDSIQQQLSDWESELEPPLWQGQKQWLEFKKYRYKDLIEGRAPRFNSFKEMNDYLKNNEEN